MSKRFLVVGVGGFAKEITDLLALLGYEVEAYFTEPSVVVRHPLSGAKIVHDLASVRCDMAVVAIGDTAARQRFRALLVDRFELPSLIHPTATVSPTARIGGGALIMPNVVVSADADIGVSAIVNVGCYVAHDCRVGAYSHLAAATQLGGGSSVGTGAFCGTGTVLLPEIHVGDWSVCGAGSVVTKDIPDYSLAVGVPARVTRSL